MESGWFDFAAIRLRDFPWHSQQRLCCGQPVQWPLSGFNTRSRQAFRPLLIGSPRSAPKRVSARTPVRRPRLSQSAHAQQVDSLNDVVPGSSAKSCKLSGESLSFLLPRLSLIGEPDQPQSRLIPASRSRR